MADDAQTRTLATIVHRVVVVMETAAMATAATAAMAPAAKGAVLAMTKSAISPYRG